jgi:putative ABC transport system permease protein
MLGISIGVGAFLCSVAVGQGAAWQIEAHIRSLGENVIWIEAGNRNVNGVRTGTHGTQSLTLRDMYAIQQHIPLLAQVSPHVDLHTQVIFRDQNWNTQIRGVAPAFVAVRGWPLARGTFFTDDDVTALRRVCVLGQTVVATLFGTADPVGQTIRVQQIPCQVLGVPAVKGQSPLGQDQDDVVLMPYTVVKKHSKGITWVDDILCSAISAAAIPLAERQITAVLREMAGAAFSTSASSRVLATIASVTRIMAGAISRISPSCHDCRSRAAEVVITVAYCARRCRWKAGCRRWRWR